jgi:2-phosphosulfolactate phosphatase
MDIDVLLLPRDLTAAHLDGSVVVVFDVLRATTTIAAALAAGVKEIRVFGDLREAQGAAALHADAAGRVLCGEANCLPPPGFDLGNSPGAFSPDLHTGRTVYMSTTNGTRAIVAARAAPVVLAGALVNASAVAGAVAGHWPGTAVSLLCAGTGGAVAMEDVLGAGAVMDALSTVSNVTPASDVALMALRLFRSTRSDLRTVLAESRGGRNVIAAGLGPDIDFAARLNALDVVGAVEKDPLAVRLLTPNSSSGVEARA